LSTGLKAGYLKNGMKLFKNRIRKSVNFANKKKEETQTLKERK